MASTSKAYRGRIGIALVALAMLAGCSKAHRHDSAEREFNAWANQVEQGNDASDLEEPDNILTRIVPANTQ